MSDVKQNAQITLPDYATAFAFSDLLQQPRFGTSSVAMLPFATQAFQLFWWGTSVGLARRESLPVLAATLAGCQVIALALEPLSSSYDEAQNRASEVDWVTAYIEKLATDGLQHTGRDPESLLDLFSESFCPSKLDFRDLRKVKGMHKRTIPLDNAGLQGSGSFLAGLSLGVSHPDLAHSLNARIYGIREDKWYSEIERAGGVGPPSPSEEHRIVEGLGITDIGREVALALLAAYLQLCAPDLLNPLRIESQLPANLTGILVSAERSIGLRGLPKP